MTKTNKSFFMVALSFVAILCSLLFVSVMPANASAESKSANGLVAWRELEFSEEIFDKTLRLYEDSSIDIYSADGEWLTISYDGMYFAGVDEEDQSPIDLVIPSVSASDEKGAYIDYVFTKEFFSSLFADVDSADIATTNVYIVVEDIDFFEGKTFIEGEYVQDGDSLANKYVRYYIDRDASALETNKYYISMYTDKVIPQSSHIADGYVDFYFPTDRLNEENLIVKDFIDNYDELTWSSTAFVYLEVDESEVDEPDIPQLDTSDRVATRKLGMYDENLLNKYIRVYALEDSILSIDGVDGSILLSATEIRYQYISEETGEYVYVKSPVEILFGEGEDDLYGAYRDYYISDEISNFFSGEMSCFAYKNVYFASLDTDYFAGKTFVEGDIVKEGDNLTNKYVRFYYDEGLSKVGSEYFLIDSTPDDGFSYVKNEEGKYIDFYFAEDRCCEEAMEVIYFFNDYSEPCSESSAFVYLEIDDGSIDNPEDVPTDTPETPGDTPTDEPEVPSDKPTDKPADEPTEEPTEKPDVKNEVDTEKLIMFGASGLLLLATLAFIISLFKKKR